MTAEANVALSTEYVDIYNRGYTPLVCIIPPGAELSTGCAIPLVGLGKVPGLRTGQGWSGYPWTSGPTPDRAAVEQWQKDGANLGLLAKHFPGIDIDCDDPDVADAIELVATRLLGAAPVRYGRRPRRLLVCRTEFPFSKRRLEFTYRGRCHVIEVLGQGQQYVIAGMHPTGTPYTWVGEGLLAFAPADLPLLTLKKIDALFDAILSELGPSAAAIRRDTGHSSSAVPLQADLVGKVEDVRAAVEVIPNESADRAYYVKLGCAIKASLPEHPVEAFDIWWSWCERWSEGINDPEVARRDWNGMHPPFKVGVQWLQDEAKKYDAGFFARLFPTFDGLPAGATVLGNAVGAGVALSASEAIAQSGLATLQIGSGLTEIDKALRQIEATVGTVSGRERGIAREELMRELRRLGVKSAAKLADAVLPPEIASEAVASGQGTAIGFKDVEPWPEVVDGNELLLEVTQTYNRFVALPEGADTVVALWTVFSHVHDAFLISPILAITSPEKRCGKTTLLEVIGALVPKPLIASNITSASLFRAIEAFSPTLLVDEADTFLNENVELRGILNSGQRRGMAYVVRTTGDDHEPRQFRTWSPKVIACIGSLPDTLTDRSVEVRMRRRRSDEAVEKLRLDRLDAFDPIRRRIARWAKDNVESLASADPTMPSGLHDRAQDNYRSLLAIADAAGGEWPSRARRAVSLRTAENNATSGVSEILLSDIRTLFEDRNVDRLSSEEIVAYLASREDRPWPEWKNEKPITVRQLAHLLAAFGVRPKQTRFGNQTRRGYERGDFLDAFGRYLAPAHASRPERPEQMPLDGAPTTSADRNGLGGVPEPERDESSRPEGAVPVVPLEMTWDGESASPELDERIIAMLLGSPSGGLYS